MKLNYDYFYVKFKSEGSKNTFLVTCDFKYQDVYYSIIVSDNKNDYIYYPIIAETGMWYRQDFDRVFNYKVELLKFDGDTIQQIYEKNFDIKDHTFHILLKSKDQNDIKIWSDYLQKIENKYNTKFDKIINGEFPEFDWTEDYVEVSRPAYDEYLKRSETPICDDYSSLTIIKSIIDI